jgi:hypothetical protein
MKGTLLVVCVLATACFAVTLKEGIDPSIPRDKCAVSIGCNEDERTAIFILGTDRQYYQKHELPERLGDWSAWKSLGGNFKGGPAIVRSSDGRLEVFGRGSDNSIWTKYQAKPNSDDEWTMWAPLGNVKFTSDPVAALSSEGFIHVFGKGIDNSLMHKTQYTNNSMFQWTEWTSLGGSLTSQPAVLLDAEGLMHIFVRGPDRALWHKHQIGGQEPRYIKWSEWQSLGGVLASAPRVPISLNTVNLLEVFVRASDKAYWHRSQIASLPTTERALDWDDWQSLGGVFSSGPSTVVNSEGFVEAFGRGADKAIWRKSQYLADGAVKWSKWVSLRGITSTGPAVRVRGDGLMEVFVRGVDKQIWSKSQEIAPNSTMSAEFGVWRSFSGSVLSEAFMC